MHISIDHSCRYMTKMNTRVGDSMRAKHRLRKSLPYYLYLDNMKYNPHVSHCGLLKSAFLVKVCSLGSPWHTYVYINAMVVIGLPSLVDWVCICPPPAQSARNWMCLALPHVGLYTCLA